MVTFVALRTVVRIRTNRRRRVERNRGAVRAPRGRRLRLGVRRGDVAKGDLRERWRPGVCSPGSLRRTVCAARPGARTS